MAVTNESHPKEFILLGFANHPWLELPLFVTLLITYPMALMGNLAIILVSTLDPRLHSPMYFFLTNLSFLDMCYTTSIVPQMLTDLRASHKDHQLHGMCSSALFVPHNLGYRGYSPGSYVLCAICGHLWISVLHLVEGQIWSSSSFLMVAEHLWGQDLVL